MKDKLIIGIEKLYGVRVFPSNGIVNGFKFTISNSIFISSMNYEDIKGVADAKGVMVGISLLREINLVSPKSKKGL